MPDNLTNTTSNAQAPQVPLGVGRVVQFGAGKGHLSGAYLVVGIDGDDVLLQSVTSRSMEPVGATFRRRADEVTVNEYARGYRHGFDYGKRGMGVTVPQGGGDLHTDYLAGYDDGYNDAWSA